MESKCPKCGAHKAHGHAYECGSVMDGWLMQRSLKCLASQVELQDSRISSLTAEVERLKELLKSLPAEVRKVGKPGPGGMQICGNIPSEVYVAIGRDRYDDEYEVAEATAEAMRENTARYIERLIKDNPNAR